MTAKPVIRSAIYTRKSSEDGLDQEFNSLDAQYEACAAYIASQRHEGWKLVPERFDDGGLSGGTLERPALKRLIAEIDAGRIGMIVVYKIDRLTRSLADFVRLVGRLDAKGASFVSVMLSSPRRPDSTIRIFFSDECSLRVARRMSFTTCSAGAFVVTGFFIILNSIWG